MLLSTVSLGLLASSVVATTLPPAQYAFSNAVEPGQMSPSGFRIPTVQESAVMARRILRYENLGTMSTVFPEAPKTFENRPTDVGGLPLGLMEYYADCDYEKANPTFIGVNISSTIRNAHAGSNITLSLRWHAPHFTHETPASLPRFALFGTLEWLSDEEVKSSNVKACFAKQHPEAVVWMPGNDIHESHWARLNVKEVYWFGGFGDRAYIGWIPLKTWHNVTDKDIESIRLPGERRWPGLSSWFGNFEL